MSPILKLRNHTISHSLFSPKTLKGAINHLGFVQADPLRSPARAQDLILRHRVSDYHVGDLNRRYPTLDIEEDLLYAYGFLPRQVWSLLHPRVIKSMTEFQEKVYHVVRDLGPTHPRQLAAHFGSKRVINDWGGFSKATKCALEELHRCGHLRVARRENGIRLYEVMTHPVGPRPVEERFRKLLGVVANILAPVNEKCLLRIAACFKYLVPGIGERRAILDELIRRGEYVSRTIDGLSYIWPESNKIRRKPPRQVRILAPFDPVVRDRERFEHLWQWSYRFEAYTPPAKRVRGAYAMPLLWIDTIVGWANARVVDKKLKIELGFVKDRPEETDFQSEVEAEIDRFANFLNLEKGSWELIT